MSAVRGAHVSRRRKGSRADSLAVVPDLSARAAVTSAIPELQNTGDRVEALLERFTGPLAPKEAHASAEELVRLLTALYGAGFERTLELVHEAAGEHSEAVFTALADDKLVASLLILHGLHPLSVEERVQRALDKVRPYLHSHDGDIEILRVEDGVVDLRLAGSCNGCPSSLATVKLTIETAILEAAPEINEVRAHGMSITNAAPALQESDWVSLDAHPALEEGGSSALDLGGSPVLLVGDGRLVRAFRNQCPQCLHGLTGAALEWPSLVCATCGGRYDVARDDVAGANAGAGLEVFPLAYDVRNPRLVRVAIPVTA